MIYESLFNVEGVLFNTEIKYIKNALKREKKHDTMKGQTKTTEKTKLFTKFSEDKQATS